MTRNEALKKIQEMLNNTDDKDVAISNIITLVEQIEYPQTSITNAHKEGWDDCKAHILEQCELNNIPIPEQILQIINK